MTAENRKRSSQAACCARCKYAYLEAPRHVSTICAHPEMTKRFDVTPFVARKEAPKRCPMEVNHA